MPARKSASSKKSPRKAAGKKAAAAGSGQIVQRKIKRFGWVPDLPDHRDKMFAAPFVHVAQLPPSVDLRPNCPPVYDQGQLGSCTANAIGAALEFDQMKQGLADVFAPSRLFIYYNERVMEGTVGQDAGAMIRDGVKSVNKVGAPHEQLWPYSDANPGPFTKKPSTAAFADARKHPAVVYQRLPQVDFQLKGCLASGYPFVFGITVYESFESSAVAKTGKVPMPKPKEKQLGGHAILAVGYDDSQRRFIIRNSWGDGWGVKGYFTIPYEYVLDSNLADDFWTIRTVQ
jgi:C1A family cysteine protease